MNLNTVFISLILSIVSILLSWTINFSASILCLIGALIVKCCNIPISGHGVDILGEISVILLMFSLGTHLDLEKASKNKFQFASSLIFMILISAICFPVIKYFISSYKWSIIISIILSISSTPIATDILIKNGEFSTKMGQFALLNLIIQDIAVALLMEISRTDDYIGIIAFLIKISIYLIIAIIIRKNSDAINLYYEKKEYEELTKEKIVLMFIALVLALSFFLNISLEFASFVVGLALAKNSTVKDINRFIEVFNLFFLNFFFISFAGSINLRDIFTIKVLAILLFCLLAKILALIAMGFLNKFSFSDSLKLALSLMSISDLSLIILKGFYDINVILVLSLLSMIISFALFKVFLIIDNRRDAKHGIALLAVKKFVVKMAEYYLIIGYGKLGKEIYSLLEEDHLPVIALDRDVNKVTEANYENKKVYYLDALRNDTYGSFQNLSNCIGVIFTIGNIEESKLIIKKIRGLNGDCRILILCFTGKDYREIKAIGGTPILIGIENFSLEIFNAIKRKIDE